MSAGDPLASEQDALLRQYYLSRGTRDTTSRWSADGPKSISPFVPCCASRIPTVLRAARLMPDDVLWDLGCGDGRLLHHAAGQYGCRCVGVDIDAPCIAEAKQRAVEQRVAHLCEFATCDLTALEPGALRPSPSAADGCVTLGAAALGDDDSSDGDAVRQRLPAPAWPQPPAPALPRLPAPASPQPPAPAWPRAPAPAWPRAPQAKAQA